MHQNQNVLITGASGGIGMETSMRFAQAGFNLVLMCHNNRDALTSLVNSFPPSCQHLIIQCDLRDNCQVQDAVNTIHKRLGLISVLVNNAGIALPLTLFSDTTEEQMKDIFETNVYSQMRLTRLLLDDLRYNKGSIINMSSIWGLTGSSCETLYSSSKAAIIGFTKALAKEMGPSGVRVNCIAPGYIDTPMNSFISEEAKESFRLSTPLQKIGSPKDVAEVVLFLAQSNYITGQIIPVDGGIST